MKREAFVKECIENLVPEVPPPAANRASVIKRLSTLRPEAGRERYELTPDELDARLLFGKHKGKLVSQIAQEECSYLSWLIDSSRSLALPEELVTLLRQHWRAWRHR